MTATESTESTERGLGGGKDIAVYSGQKVTKNRYGLVYFALLFGLIFSGMGLFIILDYLEILIF